jgi:hypothetical protein
VSVVVLCCAVVIFVVNPRALERYLSRCGFFRPETQKKHVKQNRRRRSNRRVSVSLVQSFFHCSRLSVPMISEKSRFVSRRKKMMPTTLFSSEQDHLARADQRFTMTAAAAAEGSVPITVAPAATGRMTILRTDNHYDTTDQFVSTRPTLIEPRKRHLVVLDRDQPLFTVTAGGILRRHRKSLAYVIFNKSARKRFRAGPYTRLCDIVNHPQIKTFPVLTELPFDLIDFSTDDGVISWVNIETYDDDDDDNYDDDDNNGDEREGKSSETQRRKTRGLKTTTFVRKKKTEGVTRTTTIKPRCCPGISGAQRMSVQCSFMRQREKKKIKAGFPNGGLLSSHVCCPKPILIRRCK